MTNIGYITRGVLSALRENAKAIERSLERLSTGRRINRPSDDVASFALSSHLRSQAKEFHQRTLNINSSLGLTQSLESALSTQIEIMQKIREYGIQATSASLSSSERSNISKEILSLSEQFQTITDTTEFNGQKLLTKNTELRLDGQTSIQLSANNLSNVFTKLQGTRSFAEGSSMDLPAVLNLTTTIIQDVNSDGLLDRVSAGKNYIGVELGRYDGSFSAESLYSTSEAIGGSVRLADINNDGNIDILAGGSTDLRFYLGNGDGTFSSQNILIGSYSRFDVGDINNDGSADIVSVNSVSNTLAVQLGNGDGTFNLYQTSAVGLGTGRDLKVGDLNGDGNLDFVAAVGVHLNIYFGSGDGNFTFSNSFAAIVTGLKIIDLDSDDDLDLSYISNAAAVVTHVNDGSGITGVAAGSVAGASILDYDFADFDGDSKLDLIFNTSTGSSGIYYASGTGVGQFSSAAYLVNRAGIRTVDAVDLNGDGVLDILAADTSSNLYRNYEAITQKVSAISSITNLTSASAEDVVRAADQALENLKSSLSKIAANGSGLEFRLQDAFLLRELHLETSERLQNTDVAVEMAELIRAQILQEAQLAAFAQANLNRKKLLTLLEL